MDCRLTIKNGSNFIQMLTALQQSGVKAFLLVDEKGISRKEGFIKNVMVDNADNFIEMKDGEKISIKNIIAVNGIFLPEYGEC